MTNTALRRSGTQYSNETIFKLIEEFFLGRQSRNIDRMTESFHPKIEFRGVFITIPIRGITSFVGKMKELLEQTSAFNFKLKAVSWDKELSQGGIVAEYEYINNDEKRGYRIFEIASFTVSEGLISHYIGVKEVINDWDIK